MTSLNQLATRLRLNAASMEHGKPLGGRPQQQDLFAQKEGETKCS